MILNENVSGRMPRLGFLGACLLAILALPAWSMPQSSDSASPVVASQKSDGPDNANSPAETREETENVLTLPAPLDGIKVIPGLLDEYFTIVDVELSQSGEFQAYGNPRRVVAEQALSWTLQAKKDIPGKIADQIFFRPSPPQLKFYSTGPDRKELVSGREGAGGYFLAIGRHFLTGSGDYGPQIKQGERMNAWTPLSKTGTDDLTANNASEVVIERTPWETSLPIHTNTVAQVDTNNDGALSPDEWSKIENPFKLSHGDIDLNKDGLITPEELARFSVIPLQE